MSHSTDPQMDPIEQSRSADAPEEFAPESAPMSAPEDALARKAALAPEAALAVLKGLGLLGGKAGAGKGIAPGRPERGPSASVRKKMIMELRQMLMTIELHEPPSPRKRIEHALAEAQQGTSPQQRG